MSQAKYTYYSIFHLLNLQGIPGPQGATGFPGNRGDRGPGGALGQQGPPGATVSCVLFSLLNGAQSKSKNDLKTCYGIHNSNTLNTDENL